MKCFEDRDIYRWLDGQMSQQERDDLEAHCRVCGPCREQVKHSSDFQLLLRSANVPNIEFSADFETRINKKIRDRQREPWLLSLLQDLEAWLPTPQVSELAAIALLALSVGGAGGYFAAAQDLLPQDRDSKNKAVQYLSGFQEFKGVPSPSVAAAYLRNPFPEP